MANGGGRALDLEIRAIRETIGGGRPRGRFTVGGVLRLDHLLRMQRMTGDLQPSLPSLWDRLVGEERAHAAACGGDMRVDRLLDTYAQQVVQLAAQNTEVPAVRCDRWRRERMREIRVAGDHPW
jgi:hypothetical protein